MYASHGHAPAGAVAPPTIAACAREPWWAAAEPGNDSPAATPNARLSDQMMHRCRAIPGKAGYSDQPRAGDFAHHPTTPRRGASRPSRLRHRTLRAAATRSPCISFAVGTDDALHAAPRTAPGTRRRRLS